MNSCDLLCDSLLQSLTILEKSLSFDFTAILLNETLDEPSSTNIPTAWRDNIEDPQILKNLFKILTGLYDIYELPGENEKNTFNLDITEDMVPDDVVKKVQDILNDNYMTHL